MIHEGPTWMVVVASRWKKGALSHEAGKGKETDPPPGPKERKAALLRP